MKTPFHVLGENETILHEAATESAAREWIRRYTRDGFGGWEFIALHFCGPEENTVIECFEAPEAA
jgi:hypothetical protein